MLGRVSPGQLQAFKAFKAKEREAMSTGVMEFGFDDAKVVKVQGIDQFKLDKPGAKARVSIVHFKKFHDVVLANKAREKMAAGNGPLTDEEKANYIKRVDEKLAEKLGKKPEEMTEVDRLDITNPKFSVAYTHYRDGLGTIRCLSKYEGTVCVKPDICCDKIGDAEQTVATVVIQYPVDENLQVDMDLLKARKYTHFFIYKMSAKNFKKVETAYIEARGEKRQVVDLLVTLDGDPKYKKHLIQAPSTAFWAREGFDLEVRNWILDQGLRAAKYIDNNLGFVMKREQVIERLGGQAASAAALSDGQASADAPKLVDSYDSLL